MSAILSYAWHRYLHSLNKQPLKTKSITAALLAALADLVAQRLSATSSRQGLNWRRVIALALYGGIWGGPSNHYWQGMLDRIFPSKKDPLRPVKKVLLDQLTYGPLNNVLFMLFISKVVEGRSNAVTMRKLRSSYWEIQKRGWRLWPMAQFINQSFVPLNLRVLWTNAVALLWSTSLILNSKTTGGALQTAPRYYRQLPVLLGHSYSKSHAY